MRVHLPLFCVSAFSAALVLAACDSGPSPGEALQTDADKEFEKNYKPNPKPRPDGFMAPPTDEEVAAWDRKDPEGEKHLYKWDKSNLDRMTGYWKELQCYREKVKSEGDKAFGSEPLSPEEEKWTQFKQGFIPFVNRWQQRLFANEPRIQEKSKFIGNILEAHELVMNGYPKAYNDGDDVELKKADARWVVVEDKVKKYVEQLDGEWKTPDMENPKEAEKWAKFCEKAMIEPKKDTKGKKKKTPI